MRKDILRAGRCKIIGIGEMLVTENTEDVLATYSLGSCIGVAGWDSVLRVGGVVHCLLPRAKQGGPRDGQDPARFVDLGVLELLQRLFAVGARRENLVIKVVGGGSPLQDCEGLRIGKRNQAVLRKVLWKNKLLIAAERMGGTEPRTLVLRVFDGRTIVRSGLQEEVI